MPARNDRRTPSPYAPRVLYLLRKGYTRGEIANELDVAPNVVRRVIRQECRARNTNVDGLRALDDDAVSA